MTDAPDMPPPPPPPLGAGAPGGTVDAELEAWELEIDRALASMTATITAAIEDHDAGRIDMVEFQRRCLEVGAARVGDNLILWDWVNGRVYAYDGFQVIDLTGIGR